MSNLRIPPAEISGVSGRLAARMSRKKFGEVPDLLGVVWHNRKVMRTIFATPRSTERWDLVDEDLKVYAHIVVTALIGCEFCLDLAYYKAHVEGLDEVKAREALRWRESDVFTPLERDVMAYAEAMTLTPPKVTDELSDRLLDELGPAAMVELGAFVAICNTFRMNVAWGAESMGLSSVCDVPFSEMDVPAAGGS
jgi:AhpD family alkylhydroperoxidase